MCQLMESFQWCVPMPKINPLWIIVVLLIVLAVLLPKSRLAVAQEDPPSKVAQAAAAKYNKDVKEVDRYVDIVVDAANARGIDPKIMLAIIATESNFNPKAKNPESSASGLTQVLANLHRKLINKYGGDPFDPHTSINAGTHILHSNLVATRGDMKTAITRYGGCETGEYYQKVMYNYRWIKAAGDI
jgi:soluble lytic murein transglycosylase-like protein